MSVDKQSVFQKTLTAAAMTAAIGISATQAADQPNILVIMGDDIGYWNMTTYNQGMLGYDTPNIDSIAEAGAKFTNYYGQQSSTAGRSAFITGQMPIRTGLSKVGMPGAPLGLQKDDVTLAAVLKELGYATGQFGKNHLGDKDEFLPTEHGFDEFFGNLYHLNAEQEPESEDWPTDTEFNKKFRPRGVIKSSADGTVEDTGPLTKKRMETVDAEFNAAAMDFMERSVKQDKPFFTWVNTSRMHMWTHLKEESKGLSGRGLYADGMVEHDNQVGELLAKLEELGVDENTIVVYTTDNGAMVNTFPDAGTTPFRGEKNTGWEGGFRVPAMVKWSGHIKPGTVVNDIAAHEDWMPTLAAAAGYKNLKQDILKGANINGMDYKIMLDGYDMTDVLTGKGPGLRKSFMFWADDGDLLALRQGRWKFHFAIQESEGFDVWSQPFTKLRTPMLFDMEMDPFERVDKGTGYDEWRIDRLFLLWGAVDEVKKTMGTFKEYPPSMKPASWTIK